MDYCQGIKVLTYLGSGYGGACERTPTEREKEREFYGIYYDEYRSLKNGRGRGWRRFRKAMLKYGEVWIW